MGPNREACDRCHAMKTRCVRAEGARTCIRCTKLNHECNYSATGRIGRPLGSKKNHRKESHDAPNAATACTSIPQQPRSNSSAAMTATPSSTPTSGLGSFSDMTAAMFQTEAHDDSMYWMTPHNFFAGNQSQDIFGQQEMTPPISDSSSDVFSGRSIPEIDPFSSDDEPTSPTSQSQVSHILHRLLEVQNEIIHMATYPSIEAMGPDETESLLHSCSSMIAVLNRALPRHQQQSPFKHIIERLRSDHISVRSTSVDISHPVNNFGAVQTYGDPASACGLSMDFTEGAHWT